MPNWIRLDDTQVVESTDTDPKGRFHPDLKWVKAAAHVQMGMVKQTDGSFAFPAPAPEQIDAAAPLAAAPAADAQPATEPSAQAPTEPPPAA